MKITLFREAIRERRTELKMSQNELAKKVGYRSGDIISKIECGKIEPPYDKVDDFAIALETTPERLITPIEQSGRLLEVISKEN